MEFPNEIIDKIMNMKMMIIVEEEYETYKNLMYEENYYKYCDMHIKTLFKNIKMKYYLTREESRFIGKMLKYLIYKEELKGYVIECFFEMGMPIKELPIEMYRLDEDYKYFMKWAKPNWIKGECKRWKPLWHKFDHIRKDLNGIFDLSDR